jgi:hypothetical protein
MKPHPKFTASAMTFAMIAHPGAVNLGVSGHRRLEPNFRFCDEFGSDAQLSEASSRACVEPRLA